MISVPQLCKKRVENVSLSNTILSSIVVQVYNFHGKLEKLKKIQGESAFQGEFITCSKWIRWSHMRWIIICSNKNYFYLIKSWKRAKQKLLKTVGSNQSNKKTLTIKWTPKTMVKHKVCILFFRKISHVYLKSSVTFKG